MDGWYKCTIFSNIQSVPLFLSNILSIWNVIYNILFVYWKVLNFISKCILVNLMNWTFSNSNILVLRKKFNFKIGSQIVVSFDIELIVKKLVKMLLRMTNTVEYSVYRCRQGLGMFEHLPRNFYYIIKNYY